VSIAPSDLAGNYSGVQAGASFGVGLGTNAMTGGSNNSFALQPVSPQAQTGLNVAAGLSGLALTPAAGPKPRYTRIARVRHHIRHHLRH
jgi:hypothetical protein